MRLRLLYLSWPRSSKDLSFFRVTCAWHFMCRPTSSAPLFPDQQKIHRTSGVDQIKAYSSFNTTDNIFQRWWEKKRSGPSSPKCLLTLDSLSRVSLFRHNASVIIIYSSGGNLLVHALCLVPLLFLNLLRVLIVRRHVSWVPAGGAEGTWPPGFEILYLLLTFSGHMLVSQFRSW